MDRESEPPHLPEGFLTVFVGPAQRPCLQTLANASSGQPPAPPGSWSFLDSPTTAPVVVVGGRHCTQLLRPSLSLQGTDLLGDREGVRLRARQGQRGGNEGLVSDEQSSPSLCSPSLQDTCPAGWEVTVHSGLGLWERALTSSNHGAKARCPPPPTVFWKLQTTRK